MPDSLNHTNEEKLWIAEKKVCDEFYNLVGYENPNKDIANLIEAYVGKWDPYGVHSTMETYLEKAKQGSEDLKTLIDLMKNGDVIQWGPPPVDDTKPSDTRKEKKRVLYKECQIAGITFHDLRDIWEELEEGAKLALVRHKNNKYDKYAVAVALADDYDGNLDDFDFNFILGYIPRTENEHLATMIDLGWGDAFECELSQKNGSNPYKGSLYIKIYTVSRNEIEVENTSHLLRVLEINESQYEALESNLNTKGCTYFRWGGFPPWEYNLPGKGDKVVFMYKRKEVSILYLMYCIANGDNETTAYFTGDNEAYIDDRCYYVFTNIHGPTYIEPDKLKFLPKSNINTDQPVKCLSYIDSIELRDLIDYSV